MGKGIMNKIIQCVKCDKIKEEISKEESFAFTICNRCIVTEYNNDRITQNWIKGDLNLTNIVKCAICKIVLDANMSDDLVIEFTYCDKCKDKVLWVYQPIIKDQLNHKFRWNFWEEL